MKIFPCPSCGAEVKFASAVTVFSVCAFCKAMVVRHDVNIEAIGKMAVLMEDISPLQIGSGGRFEGVCFTVIGRVKVMWDEGVWNEWYVFFDDGRYGWLAEAQGFWMMSFPAIDIPVPRQKFKIGDTLMLKGLRYTLDDMRHASCQASEGELPFQAIPGRRTLRMDFTGSAGIFACMEVDKEDRALYLGRYVDFDELNFSNLRELRGWKYERAS